MTDFFPNDENGQVLRRMQENGDDLTKVRTIEFVVVFPSKSAAEQFADHFRALGYRAQLEQTGTVPELPWDAIVARNMIPSHSAISDFEAELGLFANPLGGRTDGWGGLIQPVQH